MKKLMATLLISVILLASAVVAGPVEEFFRHEGYTKAVYPILSSKSYSGQEVTGYGQGVAIGPKTILTAGHVVRISNEDVTLVGIWIISKQLDSVGGKYKLIPARIVAQGHGKETDKFSNDWTILRVDTKLKHWVNPDIAKAKADDIVYNLSGRYLLGALIFKHTVLDIKLRRLSWDHRKIKPWNVYVLTPSPHSGDSGSPVFSEDGKLIGLVVGTDDGRLAIVVKATSFKRAYKKYRGR